MCRTDVHAYVRVRVCCVVRFHHKENVSGVNQVKSSVQRAIRAQLLDSYAALHDHLDEIIPKKEPLKIVKW